MTALALAICIAIMLSTGLGVYLRGRQIVAVAQSRDAAPRDFAKEVTLDEHRRAADYTLARTRFSIFEQAYEGGVAIGWLLFGLTPLYGVIAGWFQPGLTRSVALVVAFAALSEVLALPCSLAETFWLEARFGFNRQSPPSFLADWLKTGMLQLLIGAPLLYAMFAVLRAAPDWWWLYAFVGFMVFMIVMMAVYPTFIAPLFNKFSPLPNDDLRRRLEALLRKCGFESQGLYTMDASTRSARGNAYFTGFGKAKRIVLFDTLLAKHTPEEIEFDPRPRTRAFQVRPHQADVGLDGRARLHRLRGAVLGVGTARIGIGFSHAKRPRPGSGHRDARERAGAPCVVTLVGMALKASRIRGRRLRQGDGWRGADGFRSHAVGARQFGHADARWNICLVLLLASARSRAGCASARRRVGLARQSSPRRDFWPHRSDGALLSVHSRDLTMFPTTSGAFLGVESSLLGRRWQARLDRAGEAAADMIAQAHGFDHVLARVLAGRGVTAEGAIAYLNPTLRELMPDPLTLRDMDRAVARLVAAIEAKSPIAIFGDYDVDGACSSALLAQYLIAAGAPPPLIHIPDRILEGYGPNIPAIRDFASRGIELLVTVDCGTTSVEALAEASALGIDAVVLDHHQSPENLPPAVIVNPNRQDDLSGLGQLCAASVVFLVLVALNRELRGRGHWGVARPEPDLLAGLDLVALATVADVAALTGLNRALVTKGLAVMRERRRVGLRALMDTARMDGPPKPYDLGFLLGPRINAGGRIGDAALGARLLMVEDPIEAMRIARELESLNSQRQAIEKVTLELAEAAAEQEFRASNKLSCLVVGSEDWHPGVVGLIASRLKEKFRIPAFAIAFNDKIGTGSGRSLAGVNLGVAVRRALEAGVAIKGGGHSMAAGVTLDRDRIKEFGDFMNLTLEREVDARRRDDVLRIDAALTGRAVSLNLVRGVAMAGPFGQGNSEPLFCLPHHMVTHASVVGGTHVRAKLRAGDGAEVDAICFRALDTPLGEALLRARGASFHIATRLSAGAFRGVEKLEARIVDLAPARG